VDPGDYGLPTDDGNSADERREGQAPSALANASFLNFAPDD
jgi:nucleotide-binding universal stress UspA family protein